MDADLQWIIGLAVGLFASSIGLLVTAFKNLTNKITFLNRNTHERIDEVKDTYVRRIDEVKDTYVRRDDLADHIERIERNTVETRQEIRDNHQALMEAFTRR